MGKNEVLIREIIWDHHPTFKDSFKSVEKINYDWFNTSKLLEESMAHVGGYELIDTKHADFSDGSDCKTGTIGKKRHGNLSRVTSNAGAPKFGMLRIVLYNSITYGLHFYALPKDYWLPFVHNKGTNGEGVIAFRYDHNTQTVPKFEEHKCDTFEDLCLKANDLEEEYCYTKESTLESFFV